MTKRLTAIFVLAVSLCVSSLFAQDDNRFRPEWAFGVNAGATLSKVSFNSVIRVPEVFLPQQTAGLTVRYISEKNFGIIGELNYSLRGWKERTDTIHTNRYSRSLAYAELPVLTHLYFDISRRMRFYVNAGPQLALNIGEQTLEEEYTGDRPAYFGKDIDRHFDYGIKGGAGFELRTGIGSFLLDGSYFFGLSDIYNNKRSDLFQASSNQVVGLRLIYLVRKQKK
jgi:hypothetical protein